MDIAAMEEVDEASPRLDHEAGAAPDRPARTIMPDAMIVTNDRGEIISFSCEAEAMFGFAESELRGRHVSLLLASPEHGAEHSGTDSLHRIIAVGGLSSAQRRDGSSFPVELAVGEASTPTGRVFTAFLRDLTQADHIDERLHDLQIAHGSRTSALSALTAMLAHELNQPLTAIMNYVEAARGMLHDGPSERGLLEDALDEATAQSLRAGQIVRRLRDFIARGDNERAVQSLKGLVIEANSLALVGIRPARIDLRMQLDPAADLILVDRIQIQQVFLNLIINALEAVEQVPMKRIEIASVGISDDLVELVVSDNGCGLSQDAAANLFEPFRSTKETGLGLGLAICRTIVERQGGKIWTEPSRLGGTAFHFTLPRAAPNLMSG